MHWLEVGYKPSVLGDKDVGCAGMFFNRLPEAFKIQQIPGAPNQPYPEPKGNLSG